MSQEKVERYKQEKANRKQTVKKERMKRAASKACAWAILLLMLEGLDIRDISIMMPNSLLRQFSVRQQRLITTWMVLQNRSVKGVQFFEPPFLRFVR